MDSKSKTRVAWFGSLVILGIALSVAAPTLGKNKNTYTVEGVPKPDNHLVDWVAKHQAYAKQNLEECQQCHTNQMFCANCHERRDTIQETVHRRNFRIFHSIQARANPRRCDACHTVEYCQECHAGGGTSKR